MKGTLAILGMLVTAYAAPLFGNEVPLILEETIQMPTTLAVWDVRPTANGGLNWTWARSINDSSIEIFWGNNLEGISDTTIDYAPAVNNPPYYERRRYTPNAIAGVVDGDTRIVFLAGMHKAPDFANFRWWETAIVKVIDFDNSELIVPMRSLTDWFSSDYHGVFYITDAPVFQRFEFVPGEPTAPERVIALGYRRYWTTAGVLQMSGAFIASCLNSSVGIQISPGLQATSVCQWSNGIDAISGLHARNYFNQTRILETVEVLLEADSVQFGSTTSLDTIARAADSLQGVLFDDMFYNRSVYVVRSTSGFVNCYDIDSRSRIWTLNATYSNCLAAYVLIGDYSEQALLFRPTDYRFDIVRIETGHIWGQTSALDSGYAEMKIIGRYHNETRRLVVRYGSELRIYRFGEPIYTDANDTRPELPQALALSAYPNPFNPTTMIAFDLPKAARASLSVYDLNGRLVQTLFDEPRTAGHSEIAFNGASLPSGIYFARLVAGDFARTQKLVLLK